ncbi:Aldo-keto reductase IolS [Candidatus Hepatincola sp. Pdp]
MQLGKTNLTISSIGLGCMSMSEFYGNPLAKDKAIDLIKLAFKQGINFFDTADVYGFGSNEELIGKAVEALINENVKRKDLIIASKCGILRDKHNVSKRGIDNSYKYIKQACEKSLVRLGNSTKYIDLYYIHRIEKNITDTKIKEAMQAFAELLAENKIKAVGLSESSASVIKKAHEFLLELTNNKHGLAAVQSEYSLLTRSVESNGVLETCNNLGITFVAYSPLSRALLSGSLDVKKLDDKDFRKTLPRFQQENLDYNQKLVDVVNKLALEKNCKTSQIALAWVMAQKNVVPIPGTTKEENLLSNIKAQKIVLSKADLTRLNNIGETKGYRYTESVMNTYGLDDEI